MIRSLRLSVTHYKGKNFHLSTHQSEKFLGIGIRLREERERFSKTQDEIAAVIGTTGRTVKNYESPGGTSPRATELCALDAFGMDILYIITGIRAPLRAREPSRGYLPAEQVAVALADLKLTQEDADLLIAFAKRLGGA